MSAMARPPLGIAGLGANGPLCCASARCGRPGVGPELLASASAIATPGSVAGGCMPKAWSWMTPCPVMGRSPGSLPASGGPRGCLQHSNVSMTIIRPPQQGHAGRKSSGSSESPRSGGAATFSSSRRARCWPNELPGRQAAARKMSATSIEARTAQPSSETSAGLNSPSLSSGLVNALPCEVNRRVVEHRIAAMRKDWRPK